MEKAEVMLTNVDRVVFFCNTLVKVYWEAVEEGNYAPLENFIVDIDEFWRYEFAPRTDIFGVVEEFSRNLRQMLDCGKEGYEDNCRGVSICWPTCQHYITRLLLEFGGKSWEEVYEKVYWLNS